MAVDVALISEIFLCSGTYFMWRRYQSTVFIHVDIDVGHRSLSAEHGVPEEDTLEPLKNS